MLERLASEPDCIFITLASGRLGRGDPGRRGLVPQAGSGNADELFTDRKLLPGSVRGHPEPREKRRGRAIRSIYTNNENPVA
jgi:hypothetical protein